VLDYSFGNFFLEATSIPAPVSGGLTREATTPAAANELAVATFNVENLDPSDGAAKFDRLAGLIVNNLKSPDVIAVEEVQDSNGAKDDGTVDPSQTLAMLIASIQAAGGPTYEYRQINPVNDQDGGEPGGNIRQVFLFRTDRGLSFVDRPGGGSTTATGVAGSGGDTHLTFSPGRIDPASSAWSTSRKPLAGEFMFHGRHVFVIANHFNSKGGDNPLLGRFQPPVRSSEVQRHQQAQIVHDFVASILGSDANANVIVAGDLNDFEFSDTVSILKDSVLTDLIETLPLNERYSYDFEGNSQTLDHVLMSGALVARPFEFDVVHVNSEFADQASDHDPSVVRITLDRSPTVSAAGPYAVDEGGSVMLSASADDPDGDPVTYAWDLDGDGTFETTGQTVAFHAGDGADTKSVAVRATDPGGLSATDSTTVAIANVAPTASFQASGSVTAGDTIALSLSDPLDPSAVDTAAGFQYAFDCGDGSGYGAFSPASSATCPTASRGTRSVGGEIRDKDSGVREYRSTVTVNGRAPIISAGGPYGVDESGSVTLTASGSDPDGDAIAYAWDLDGNGTFETSGQAVTFHAGDGPTTLTVAVQGTDATGATVSGSATVTVRNVAPTATLDAPARADAGFPFTLSLTNAHDASPADVAAGFSYAFDCGDGTGFGPWTSSATASCPTDDAAPRSVGGRIRDKDGGVSERRATVRLTVGTNSLCALVRSYITKPGNEDDELCRKLAEIAKADAKDKDKQREKKIDEFQKRVAKDVPRWLTAEQAEILIRLSEEL
jgi:endonuclease/exonuclease/phosphatase family metal-dependent hydrolase